uniref:hypothetical protein n=1 Tax=Prevotella sp. TaxID=59823 RepID=UPI0040250FCA
MMTLAIIIFIALALYVLSCCVVKRVPTMLSEVYYLADKDWLFPALIATLGASFLPLMLSKGGLECMAFLTCVGIIFVGAAPAYLDESQRTIHKCGAITSAIASVAWACSISVLPTVLFAVLAAVLCIWKRRYWLFIAECCAILNIVKTLFI